MWKTLASTLNWHLTALMLSGLGDYAIPDRCGLIAWSDGYLLTLHVRADSMPPNSGTPLPSDNADAVCRRWLTGYVHVDRDRTYPDRRSRW